METIDKFEGLLGHVLLAVENHDDDELVFTVENGDRYMLYHQQDCCEYVRIEDIVGDLNDLVGLPILLAEEVISYDEPAPTEWEESYTWTFYKLSTNRGSVTIRWYGSSNGYYSERVDWMKI